MQLFRRKPWSILSLSLLVAMVVGPTARTQDWPQFRGPTGRGHSRDKALPLRWGGKDGTNVLWKSPLIGEGHASPVISGDRVLVCTAYWPDSVKNRAKVMPEHHVQCYRMTNGKRLWDVQVEPGPWLRSDFRSGPGGGYAAPTPATDGKLVFVVFGSSVMAALDHDSPLGPILAPSCDRGHGAAARVLLF